MPVSDTLFELAQRWPRTRATLVRGLGNWYLFTGSRTHWVFDRLRAQAGIRFRRRLRLATGAVIHGDPFDLIGAHIRRHGLYEPETVRVFQQLAGPGMTVVDAGANIGQYTLIAAQRVGPRGQVHAFEPNPACVADLQRSLAENGFAQARVVPMGLWQEGTEATLFEGDVENLGASSLRPGLYTTGQRARIRLTTLDAYTADAGLQRLDLIKADVEGAELGMLRGGEATITRFRPALLMEFSEQSAAFGWSKADQAGWLIERGYTLHAIDRDRLRHYDPAADRSSIVNVVALPAESAIEGRFARLLAEP